METIENRQIIMLQVKTPATAVKGTISSDKKAVD